MYQHYIDAVQEVWGDEVRIVVDRYHVTKKYQDCADKLRKKELRLFGISRAKSHIL